MPTNLATCRTHKPLPLDYVSWHMEAERRVKRKMKQRRCPKCGRWLWRDEYGPGWKDGGLS